MGNPTGNRKLCSEEGCNRFRDSRGLCDVHYQRQRRRGLMPPLQKRTTEERFWAKVDKSGECWLWTAGRFSDGYGSFSVSVPNQRHMKARLAHHYVWELTNGPVPEGMIIDHKCRVRECVNPDHLRLATHKQNSENLGNDRANNTSGVRGVYWDKRNGKWRASVQMKIHVGEFHTLAEAEAAVRAKRRELHTHNDEDRTGT